MAASVVRAVKKHSSARQLLCPFAFVDSAYRCAAGALKDVKEKCNSTAQVRVWAQSHNKPSAASPSREKIETVETNVYGWMVISAHICALSLVLIVTTCLLVDLMMS